MMGIDVDQVLETYVAIPKTEDEIKLVERLAKEAVLKAVVRHAGQIRYVYGPSGRSTVAEGKDLTQVKYIVGTGGALTRLPHRVELMQEIAKHNETGLMLFPGQHAEILVDNDYIMASLGVLSKKYKEATIKLLEKSLDFQFPKEKPAFGETKATYKLELERLQAEKEAKEAAYKAHVKEVKAQGHKV